MIKNIFIYQCVIFYIVGDKGHHEPVVHLSMPLHLCTILTLLLLPIAISDIYQVISNATNHAKVSHSKINKGVITKKNNINLKSDICDSINDNRKNIRDRSDETAIGSRGSVSGNVEIKGNDSKNRIPPWLIHSVGLLMVTLALQYSCLSHPFLLADNRYVLCKCINAYTCLCIYVYNMIIILMC